MITVRHQDAFVDLHEGQLLQLLCGLSRRAPSAIDWTMLPLVKGVEICIHEAGPGERYFVKIDGVDAVLPSTWVIPWAEGVALSYGAILSTRLTAKHERARRMQALLLCHHEGWLTYVGITEEGKGS